MEPYIQVMVGLSKKIPYHYPVACLNGSWHTTEKKKLPCFIPKKAIKGRRIHATAKWRTDNIKALGIIPLASFLTGLI
jgi:hypothetical protein